MCKKRSFIDVGCCAGLVTKTRSIRWFRPFGLDCGGPRELMPEPLVQQTADNISNGNFRNGVSVSVECRSWPLCRPPAPSPPQSKAKPARWWRWLATEEKRREELMLCLAAATMKDEWLANPWRRRNRLQNRGLSFLVSCLVSKRILAVISSGR